MKPEQLYQHLKELAEKLGITIDEENLRKGAAGIKVRSGLCRVQGERRFILDKRLSLKDKNELLAGCLAQFSHEDVYVVPAVRDILKKCLPFTEGEQVDEDHAPIRG
jgi:hypothetical protein